MGVLAELGFADGESRGLLIDPPDHVLAEAGALSPRPTIASSLQTAEPAARIAWWPGESRLDPGAVSRLHWMVQVARGEAFVVFDLEDVANAGEARIREAVAESQFRDAGDLQLQSGETAIRLLP